MSEISSLERLQHLLPQLFQAQQQPGQPYLRFQLSQDSLALLSMKQVQESVLVAAEQITPVPNMPSSVLGLTNSRNTVFLVVDLPHLMELTTSQINPQHYQVIVVRVPSIQPTPQSSEQESFLGLAVPRILGVTRLVERDIQPIGKAISASLTPYLSGQILEQEQAIAVLDLKTIVTAPSLQSH
jgi:positive phototaxis protein PixI